MKVITAYRDDGNYTWKQPIYGCGPWWIVLALKIGSLGTRLYQWADAHLIDPEDLADAKTEAAKAKADLAEFQTRCATCRGVGSIYCTDSFTRQWYLCPTCKGSCLFQSYAPPADAQASDARLTDSAEGTATGSAPDRDPSSATAEGR